MENILHHSIATQYVERGVRTSVFTRFMNFCKGQEKNRLLWLGIVLMAQGCILMPLTVMTVLLAGSNLVLMILALVSMGIALVTNLAAQPTKVTIPAFVLSIIIDIAIIISAATMGFDISKTTI